MSMPHEHTRALIKTYDFLKELSQRDDIPVDLQDTAVWLLRHYPTPSTVLSVGAAIMPHGIQNPFATCEDYDQHIENMKSIRN